MPIISMFYGIIIRMYLLDNKHHSIPHIHAKYAEFEASISIARGRNTGWKLAAQTITTGTGMD